MAAHDDKISDNRRRLFKALSAAPVVATLRPGSAVASSSAFQCLNTTSPALPDNGFHETDPGCSSSDPTCFAYRAWPFYDLGDGSATYRDRDGTVSTDPNPPGDCSDLATKKITEMGSPSVWYDVETGDPLSSADAARIVKDGTTVSVLYTPDPVSGATPPCIVGIPAQSGRALMIGEELVDNSDPTNVTRSFIETGMWPKNKPGDGGPLGGVSQCITGTCLDSIPNQLIGGQPFISKG